MLHADYEDYEDYDDSGGPGCLNGSRAEPWPLKRVTGSLCCMLIMRIMRIMRILGGQGV